MHGWQGGLLPAASLLGSLIKQLNSVNSWLIRFNSTYIKAFRYKEIFLAKHIVTFVVLLQNTLIEQSDRGFGLQPVFVKPKPLSKILDPPLNIISDNISKPCPLVVKPYCSGTPTYLPFIFKKVSQPDCKLKLTGVIFDSSPPLTSAKDIIQANFLRSRRDTQQCTTG